MNRRGKKIVSIIIAFLLICVCTFWVIGATEETTNITFQDNNLYNTVKTVLGSRYIVGSQNDTKTIEIRTADIPLITSLELANAAIRDLSGIENFTALTSLDISKNEVSDLSNLSNLTNLNTLILNSNKIRNLTQISNLTNLTTLLVSGNQITDITPIADLSNLQEIDLSSNSISNVTVIKSLTNLTKINVSQNKSITNISDFFLPKLESLNLSNTGITNLTGISTIRQLKELNLANNQIEDLNPLFETEQVDYQNLAILREIENLDLRYTTNYGISFSQLALLSNLKRLDLQGNGITDIYGITSLKKLEYVNLEDNRINSLEGVKSVEYDSTTGKEIDVYLTATQISLKKNSISDLTPLAGLTKIDYLDLSENYVQDISPIEKFDFVQGVYLANQTINFEVYQKATEDNQYIILPEIMQKAKTNGSLVYADNITFSTEGVTLNSESIYQEAPYYNVIVPFGKTYEDVLTVTLNGGIADGTVLNLTMTTSSNAIDTVRFKDENLDRAIYSYLQENIGDELVYLARAPFMINISQYKIAAIYLFDLSNQEITNLDGLQSFVGLRNLNISHNNISDDSYLKALTYLENLNMANNQLDNHYTSIENLYYLKSLDLSGNNIKDLGSLEKLLTNVSNNGGNLQLTELILNDNAIQDINVVSRIPSLQKLVAHQNQIQDLAALSTLTQLNTIDLSNNQIEDVTILNTLRALKTVYLDNNKIVTIPNIRNLSLSILSLSGNKISDLTPLSTQTSLTKLYLNYNKIEDVTPIERLLLSGGVELKQQRIVYALEEATGSITIPLPLIFKSSKDSTSKVYSNQDFEMSECTLSEDGNNVVIDVNALQGKIATVKIKGGTANATTLSIAEPLVGNITYHITEKTKEDVVATLSFNRNNVTILNNDGNNTYTFTQNGEFVFEYKDEYGFEGSKTASVNWIDKEGPVGEIVYQTEQVTKENLIVTITANEPIQEIEGWQYMNEDRTQITKAYSENTTENVVLKDELGNESTLTVTITNIDKVAPIVQGVEEGKTYDAIVTPIVTDEHLASVILKKDGQEVTGYQNGNPITQNGSYELEAVDEAGNMTIVKFIISMIVNDSITSEQYMIDDDNFMITKVPPHITVLDFKNKIHTEVMYQILNQNKNEIFDTEIVTTGSYIVTQTGKEYKIVVMGDANQDGNISITDVLMVLRHIAANKTGTHEEWKQTGIVAEAMDVNRDEKIDTTDVIKLYRYIAAVKSDLVKEKHADWLILP